MSGLKEPKIRTYCVYKHTSPSGKVYIGITSQNPIKRWSGGSGYKDSPAFWNAIRKYGWNNITHEILKTDLSKSEAESEEIRLIKMYKSTDREFGYNVENGGNCAGTHSEETRKKISDCNKGKTYSAESIEKMRQAHKGKQVGKDNPFFGRHHSEETKLAQSVFMQGNTYFKGHHHTEEFKRMKSEQMREKYSGGKNPRCKKIVCRSSDNIVTYDSMREAARQNGVSVSTVFKWVNDDSNSCWGYKDA